MSRQRSRVGPAPIPDQERVRAEYTDRAARLAGRDTYSLFNPGHLYMIQERQRAVLALLQRAGCVPLAGKRVLEVGCGAGSVLHEFLNYGANPERLHGADLLGWRLAEAHAGLPALPLAQADGEHLPYPDACFDLVMQFTCSVRYWIVL